MNGLIWAFKKVFGLLLKILIYRPKKGKIVAEKYVPLKILSVYELEDWIYVKIDLQVYFCDGILDYMADI